MSNKNLNLELKIIRLAVKEMTTKLQKTRRLGDNPKLHASINNIVRETESIQAQQFELGLSDNDLR